MIVKTLHILSIGEGQMTNIAAKHGHGADLFSSTIMRKL